jgi:hypothetical protein
MNKMTFDKSILVQRDESKEVGAKRLAAALQKNFPKIWIRLIGW